MWNAGDYSNLLFGGMASGPFQPDPRGAQFGDRNAILGGAQQGIANARNRQAPQAGGTAVGQVSQFGGPAAASQQQALADQLARVGSGQQMGAGELAARRAGQQALGNAMGSATMARGANAASGAQI